MSNTQATIELVPCLRYVRGYMAYIWKDGALFQVFTGPARSDVEADAQHYAGMISRGLA